MDNWTDEEFSKYVEDSTDLYWSQIDDTKELVKTLICKGSLTEDEQKKLEDAKYFLFCHGE